MPDLSDFKKALPAGIYRYVIPFTICDNGKIIVGNQELRMVYSDLPIHVSKRGF